MQFIFFSNGTFGNINLTKTVIDLIVDSKFNQKRLQESLHLYPKSFKVTLEPNSYLMSTCRCGQENQSTYTFCSNDLTQTMAYWCSQKVVGYQKNIIETESDHFMNDLFVFFLSNCSLDYFEGGSKLSEFFVSMCTASGFWILQNMFALQYLL